ncbi:MAG: prepilin peptidase [Candidatus Peribacteraceae bacterium]|nr:prepilin peptidase [Candidatus Peribacteraceae bacterium]
MPIHPRRSHMTVFPVPPAFLAPFAALVGVALGSFGNVLIYRVPRMEGVGGRSRCPHCSRVLTAWELIPLLSFVLLRGRCRGCRASIALLYPLVELLSGAVFPLGLWLSGWQVLPGLVLGTALWFFLLAAAMDLQTGLVSDAFSIPLLFFAGFYAFQHPGLSLLPALIGGAFFGVQWVAGGGGGGGSADVLVGAAMGFLAGTVPLLLTALFAAYIIGACVAAVLLLSGRRTMGEQLEFIPFLFAGTVIALVWGERIVQAYVGG